MVMLCWLCNQPIPADEMVQGKPIRVLGGEPVCLDCHLEIQREHRNQKSENDFRIK